MDKLELIDYFAGQVLNAICSNSDTLNIAASQAKKADVEVEESIAMSAYLQAIAMIKAKHLLIENGLI